MNSCFSDRIADVPRSFIREILKTTIDESVISFAGGLPNRNLFPVEEIKKAAIAVLDHVAGDALQYSTSEGYLPLRIWIAERYRKNSGLTIDPDNILITTGSQQGLDLIGKIMLNEGDHVGIEEPGYLGAIQAFSLYRPVFHPVPLGWDGIDTSAFRKTMSDFPIKLFYAVPNFQNPSGIAHSDDNRRENAAVLRTTQTIFVEDDPYGDLRFSGLRRMSFASLALENTIMLGSFSKIFVPSFRIGWIVARKDIMEKLVIAKQASDLHTNYFGQRVLYQYLLDNDIDAHIKKINATYSRQRDSMVDAVKTFFPEGVRYSEPTGGMFMWVVLPESMSALQLFERSIEQKVAFVPGDPFYVHRSNVNTLRLNFSCVDEDTIRVGIERLGRIIQDMNI